MSDGYVVRIVHFSGWAEAFEHPFREMPGKPVFGVYHGIFTSPEVYALRYQNDGVALKTLTNYKASLNKSELFGVP